MELYTGELLFPTYEDYEHIAMIEKLRGKIPFWMANNCKNDNKKYFLLDDKNFYEVRGTYYNWPQDSKSQDSV